MIRERVLGTAKLLAGFCIVLAHINASTSQRNFVAQRPENGQVSLGQPWPKAVVMYVMDPKFTKDESSLILTAMKEVRTKTCVVFRVHDSARRGQHFVKIVRGTPGSNCRSELGYAPKEREGSSHQNLNLQPRQCLQNSATVIRQLLHTLGLYQPEEQFRNDLDDYDNIDQGTNNQRRRRQISKTEKEFKLSREDALKVRKLYNFDPDVCEALCNGRRCVKETTKRPLLPTAQPHVWSHAPAKAHLFTEVDHKGTREEFNPNSSPNVGCHNLNQLAGRVKSIHTYNTCAQVYHGRDCRGKSLQFHPWSVDHQGRHQGHGHMGDEWLGIHSIGPCTKAPPHVACPQEKFQCRDGRCLKSYLDCLPNVYRTRRDVIPFVNATSTM